MKHIKSSLLVAIAMVLTVNLFATTALASTVTDIPIRTNSIVSPQANQTEWAYRTYNGVLQKRLWSITQGKWLTDWIKV